MTHINHFLRFEQRPTGAVTPEVFQTGEAPVPELRDGEFLLKNTLLSMDPALVSRMRAEGNYAESVNPGDVMHAYGIGQVVESRNAAVRAGEVRMGRVDMQEYGVASDADATTVINLGIAEPSWYLSVAGITGATAYLSLDMIGGLRAGETVVISAGGSSVGTVVAQLARRAGCRTVGIVSTDEKARQVQRDWGYDAVTSYRGKPIEQLEADLRAACPDGVDLYYDNTSGDISEALIELYNDHARIVVIGRLGIAHLADTRDDRGRRDNNAILSKRIRKQGFVLLDHMHRMPEAVLQLATWVKRGELEFHVDFMDGIENAQEAFFRMLDGANRGKQLLRLAEIDDRLDPAPRAIGRLLTSRMAPTALLTRLIRKKRGVSS